MLGAPIRTGPLLIAAIAYPAAIAIGPSAAMALRSFALGGLEWTLAFICLIFTLILTPAVLSFWLGWDWSRTNGPETRRGPMWRASLILTASWVVVAVTVRMIEAKVFRIRLDLGLLEHTSPSIALIGPLIALIIIARFGMTLGQNRGGKTFDSRLAQTF